MSHGVRMKLRQHNPVALQLHVQKWCSREHQGYGSEISFGLRVSSQISCSDGHSEAAQKWDNFEPTRLTCVAHVTHDGSKRVTHSLHNSKRVCNPWGSDRGGRTSVVDGIRDDTTIGNRADTALKLNDSSNIWTMYQIWHMHNYLQDVELEETLLMLRGGSRVATGEEPTRNIS
jgi:hypothetical protein